MGCTERNGRKQGGWWEEGTVESGEGDRKTMRRRAMKAEVEDRRNKLEKRRDLENEEEEELDKTQQQTRGDEKAGE